MYKIAVCDDDPNVVDYTQRYLNEKSNSISEKISTSTFSSAKDFLNHVKKGNAYHIVFMDIVMEEMDGTEAVSKLRDLPNGDDVLLIYMSNHDSYYEKVAQEGVFRFLNKPLTREKLEDAFSRAIKVVSKNTEERLFHYKINKDVYSVPEKEIVFFEIANKSLSIYTWNGKERRIVYLEEFYSSIRSAIEILPEENFVQCARSYLINFDYVKNKIGSTHFVLKDKEKTQIPIGIKYKKNVQDAYTKYRSNQYG